MKRVYFLNVLLVLFIAFSLAGCKKTYKYNPETKEELKTLVDNESISLGDINTSKITDMSKLFQYSERDNFTGIEKWNVSKVENMDGMFNEASNFNQDIGNWDVSNVKYMNGMFTSSPPENNPPAWYTNWFKK